MSSQSKYMDANRLTSITAEAVSSVLFFHTKRITPPADIRRAGLEKAINAVFHLRLRAADTAVAHLEIACDAALSYADDYNEIHPGNTIHPRWMYVCVQALLSHRLKPALMESGKMQRLLDCVAQQEGFESQTHSSELGLDKGPTLSSIELQTSSSQHSSELGVAFTSDDDDDDEEKEEQEQEQEQEQEEQKEEASSFVWPFRSRKSYSNVIRPERKIPWKDADICRLIKLRAQGLTHYETAECLGRGKGSVENKYGRVVKDTTWKPYVAQCAARFLEMRRGKRKLPLEIKEEEEEDDDNDNNDNNDGDGEDGEDEEDNEDVEGKRLRSVAKKRKVMLAAATRFE